MNKYHQQQPGSLEPNNFVSVLPLALPFYYGIGESLAPLLIDFIGRIFGFVQSCAEKLASIHRYSLNHLKGNTTIKGFLPGRYAQEE